MNATMASISPEHKLSPVAHISYRRSLAANNKRSNDERYLKSYFIAFSILAVEKFVFDSWIVSFLFANVIPYSIVSTTELVVLIYLTSLVAYYCAAIYLPSANINFQGLFSDGSNNKVSASSSQFLNTSLDQSADLSWVDAHRFGTPHQSFTAQSKSHNMSGAQRLEDSSIFSSVSSIQNTPAIDSIHTRKQLEVLLRSTDNSATGEGDSIHNPYLSYLNVFDYGRSDSKRSYQLSDNCVEKENSVYDMKVGVGGRVNVSLCSDDDQGGELGRMKKIMQQVRTSPEKITPILKRTNSTEGRRSGVRRRSHSSPDRQSTSDLFGLESDIHKNKSGPLREDALRRGEFKLRAWIRNTIFAPLVKHIKDLNQILDKEHASPPLRIGSSTVDALKLAIMERDSLKSTALPFVLPFLGVHQNQAYLVSRINELCESEFLDAYRWNNGGTEPTEEKSSGSRVMRREWNEGLPTDAVLVFDLFSVYMDLQLNSTALVGSCRLDQPFTARYVVKTPNKPSLVQQQPFGFYVNLVTVTPPHYEFVYLDMTATPIRCSVARQSSNLFRALLHFVNHIKEDNDGLLDYTSIGPSGLNLACVLN